MPQRDETRKRKTKVSPAMFAYVQVSQSGEEEDENSDPALIPGLRL